MTKQQAARERLTRDMRHAVALYAAEQLASDRVELAKSILRERHNMADNLVTYLARNWRMTERARPARAAT